MTSSPVALERKVRQMDNDVQSIYEMLSAIQGTQLRHGNRFDELDDKMTALEGKVDGLAGRFDALEGKVDGLAGRFDALEGKVDGLAGKVDGPAGRFDALEGKVDGLAGKVDGLTTGMQSVLELLRAG